MYTLIPKPVSLQNTTVVMLLTFYLKFSFYFLCVPIIMIQIMSRSIPKRFPLFLCLCDHQLVLFVLYQFWLLPIPREWRNNIKMSDEACRRQSSDSISRLCSIPLFGFSLQIEASRYNFQSWRTDNRRIMQFCEWTQLPGFWCNRQTNFPWCS